MGLHDVMLARMKLSHGLTRGHRAHQEGGSFSRREQLPALPNTLRGAYALKQKQITARGPARTSYKQPPPRRRRRPPRDDREDTIIEPPRRRAERLQNDPRRRASDWKSEPPRRRLPPRQAAPAEPARRQEPTRDTFDARSRPARLTAEALAAHERPHAPPTHVREPPARRVAPPPVRVPPLRLREPPPHVREPRAVPSVQEPPARQASPQTVPIVRPPQQRQALPPLQKLPDKSPSKRFADRVSCAGKGVASKPDRDFFLRRRENHDKKMAFKYGKNDNLSWERKAGDEKYDPPPHAPVDYAKHYRTLQGERENNRQLRMKNSASTLRLGDHAPDYWRSNHELFAGRVSGGELGRQRAENILTKQRASSSTLTLGDDPDYY